MRPRVDDSMRRVSPFERMALAALRIGVGFLFLQHGVQKLFGGLGGEAVRLLSVRGVAGALELLGGAMLLVGAWTRPVALVLLLEMLVAYGWRHAPRGFWPLENGGERAALYAAVFLYLTARGGGGFGIDGLRWWRSRARARGRAGRG